MIIRNLEAVFSFRYNPEKLRKATASLDDFAHKANLAIGAIAGSVAMQAINSFMDNTAAAVDQIGKTSSKLGLKLQINWPLFIYHQFEAKRSIVFSLQPKQLGQISDPNKQNLLKTQFVLVAHVPTF